MRIVDTKGLTCPVPIIETKKALKSAYDGETFQLQTDNKTAYSNISKFLSDNKVKFSVEEKKGVWTFTITNETGTVINTQPEEYCEVPAPETTNGNYCVVISSEIMGQGNDELGRKLMKSFFTALSCMDRMPSAIMFYNSGVKLTVDDSPVAEMLHEIQNKDTEILICGTCVDFYGIAQKIHIGRISDMYQITQKQSESGTIIRP
jgi:selenium metabolism protein YedF